MSREAAEDVIPGASRSPSRVLHRYVYYKVARQQAAACIEGVALALASLEQDRPGVTARVLRRADENGKPDVTLMETYVGIDDDLVWHAHDLRMQVTTAPWRQGDRHCEVFVPVEPGGEAE